MFEGTWSSDAEPIVFEIDGQEVELSTWSRVFKALESSGVTDAQVKGHVVTRHFPEEARPWLKDGEDAVQCANVFSNETHLMLPLISQGSSDGDEGHFAISPRQGVSSWFKYPLPGARTLICYT